MPGSEGNLASDIENPDPAAVAAPTEDKPDTKTPAASAPEGQEAEPSDNGKSDDAKAADSRAAGTQAAPVPPKIREMESDIKRESRRWRAGVRAGTAFDPELFMFGVQSQRGT